MTIAELDAKLDAGRDTLPKPKLVELMAERNRLIRQAELDHWCLTEAQYAAAIADTSMSKQAALQAAQRAAMRELRSVQTANAGVVGSGVKATNIGG